jgi:hypothetical protein
LQLAQMTKAEFKHYDLTLIEPAFDSPLTDLIIDLNHLVDKKMLQRIGFKDYVISFGDNYLLRSIMKVLREKDFLPHLDGK